MDSYKERLHLHIDQLEVKIAAELAALEPLRRRKNLIEAEIKVCQKALSHCIRLQLSSANRVLGQDLLNMLDDHNKHIMAGTDHMYADRYEQEMELIQLTEQLGTKLAAKACDSVAAAGGDAAVKVAEKAVLESQVKIEVVVDDGAQAPPPVSFKLP